MIVVVVLLSATQATMLSALSPFFDDNSVNKSSGEDNNCGVAVSPPLSIKTGESILLGPSLFFTALSSSHSSSAEDSSLPNLSSSQSS